MKKIAWLLILWPQICFSQVSQFAELGKTVLFVDTLLKEDNVDKKINELQTDVLFLSDSVKLAIANYNLGICFVAKKDYQTAITYIEKSLTQSNALHTLILTDTDFSILYSTPRWTNVINKIDSIYLASQPNIKDKVLSTRLYHILLKDQQGRGLGVKNNLTPLNFDEENIEQVKKILDDYGWPTFSSVGRIAAMGAFIVIQHADLNTQNKYYPLLSQAVFKNEADKESFALMTDRLSVRTNGYQIYGTQVFRKIDKVTGKAGNYSYYPINNEAGVDRKRSELGLIPLKEYFRRFGIVYPDNKP